MKGFKLFADALRWAVANAEGMVSCKVSYFTGRELVVVCWPSDECPMRFSDAMRGCERENTFAAGWEWQDITPVVDNMKHV